MISKSRCFQDSG